MTMGKRRLLLVLAVTAAVLLIAWPAQEDPDAPLSSEERARAAGGTGMTADAEAPTGPGLRTTVRPIGQTARTAPAGRSANAVRVTVTAHGKPVAQRGVRVWGTAIRPARALFLDAKTGADGTCTLMLPPGSFHIGLIPYAGTSALILAADPDDPMTLGYAQTLELETDHGKAHLEFEIPGGTLRVVVRDADRDRTIEGVHVTVFNADFGKYGTRSSARTDEDGVAVLRELGPGEIRVNAAKTGWAKDPKAKQTSRTLAENEDASVEISLRATGTLILGLVDETGQRVFPPRGFWPTLVHAETGRPPVYESRAPDRMIGRELRIRGNDPQPLRVRRIGLLPGTYKLSIEDESVITPTGLAIRPQPFEPVPAREVEIRARETTSLELPVQPRTRVALVSLDLRTARARRAPLRVQIEVFRTDADTGKRVRYLPTRHYPGMVVLGYQGFLPRGTYEVEIKPVGSRRKPRIERLVVEGERVHKTYEYEDPGR